MSEQTKQTTGDFTITKDMIVGYCQKGLTVEEIATKITEESGFKCSVGVIRKAAKNYEIALRNKPKKSPFSFEEKKVAPVQAAVAPTEGTIN